MYKKTVMGGCSRQRWKMPSEIFIKHFNQWWISWTSWNTLLSLTKCHGPCFPLVPTIFQEPLQEGDGGRRRQKVLRRTWRWWLSGGQMEFVAFWGLHKPCLILPLTSLQLVLLKCFFILWFEALLCSSRKAGNVSKNSPILTELPLQPEHTNNT